MKLSRIAGAVVLLLAGASPAAAERILVRDQAAYRQAARALQPGDEIVLADGEWRDFRILFEGQGTAGRPITLTAETPGGVVLTGQSDLRLAGEHLVVSGLVFRDGWAPDEEVIAFRRDSRRVANHSRITGIVIDRFNPPDRRREDRWVSVYGRSNRVDHSHFAGKTSAGVTLAVIRPRGQGFANDHRIDHNYFGQRPPLGANGGETIRIGTSEESLSDSRTIVENNYFDRCDGEVEIVSVKSGGNVLRGNTFFQSQGALVLRHGNGNLVERNVFIGNGRPNTGGIRVINRNQIVRFNYLEDLTGTGFASALTVMNGVPDSAINRYHQVANARIERNTIVGARRITLAAGADAERSAPPIDSRFERNLIVGPEGPDPFRAEGDISGIAFAGNVQSPVERPTIDRGVERRPLVMRRAANGLLYPAEPELAETGAPHDLVPIAREATGVAWYPKPTVEDSGAAGGPVVELPAGAPLAEAVASAPAGTLIRLAPGEHRVASPIRIDRPIALAGPESEPAATIAFTSPILFRIENGGRLRLSHLAITGAGAPRQPGNAVIRTADDSMPENYSVEMTSVSVAGLDGAPEFDVIATAPETLADHVLIRSSRFEDVSGAVLAAASETGEQGYYSAERIEIAESEFRRVGRVAVVRRGGRDESTFGPRFRMTGSLVEASGGPGSPPLVLTGVQQTLIADNRFVSSGPIEVLHTVGSPETVIRANIFTATPPPQVAERDWRGAPRALLSDNRVEARP